MPVVVAFQKLTEAMLVDILQKPKNAILKQYVKLLAMDEVKLVFEEGALQWIAREAAARETGARALRAIMEEFMLDIMYEVPKDPGNRHRGNHPELPGKKRTVPGLRCGARPSGSENDWYRSSVPYPHSGWDRNKKNFAQRRGPAGPLTALLFIPGVIAFDICPRSTGRAAAPAAWAAATEEPVMRVMGYSPGTEETPGPYTSTPGTRDLVHPGYSRGWSGCRGCRPRGCRC